MLKNLSLLLLFAGCTSGQPMTATTVQGVALSDGIMFSGSSMQGSGTMADPIDMAGSPTATLGQVVTSDGNDGIVWGGPNLVASGSDATITFNGSGGVAQNGLLNLTEANGDVTDDMISIDRYINTHNGGKVNFRKTKGTQASPTIVANGDQLGVLRAWGYDGAAFQQSVVVTWQVGGTPSAGVVPGLLDVTLADSAGSLRDRWQIDAQGHEISLGATSYAKPAVSACGTGFTQGGTDTDGWVTEGTGATGCTITYAKAFTTSTSVTANCVASSPNAAGAPFTYIDNDVSLTITNAAGAPTGMTVKYHCAGYL